MEIIARDFAIMKSTLDIYFHLKFSEEVNQSISFIINYNYQG